MRRPYLHKLASNYRKTGAKLARCNNINWPLNSLNATYCRMLLCKWCNIGDTYCNQLQNRELPSPCLPICSDCDNICILSQGTIWNHYACCETSKLVFLRSLIREVYVLECTMYIFFFSGCTFWWCLIKRRKDKQQSIIWWPAAQTCAWEWGAKIIVTDAPGLRPFKCNVSWLKCPVYVLVHIHTVEKQHQKKHKNKNVIRVLKAVDQVSWVWIH